MFPFCLKEASKNNVLNHPSPLFVVVTLSVAFFACAQLVAEIFTLTGAHVRTLSLSNVGADIFVYGLLVSVPTNSVYVCGGQRSSSYTVTISRVRFVGFFLLLYVIFPGHNAGFRECHCSIFLWFS